jgi:hypothetical protein
LRCFEIPPRPIKCPGTSPVPVSRAAPIPIPTTIRKHPAQAARLWKGASKSRTGDSSSISTKAWSSVWRILETKTAGPIPIHSAWKTERCGTCTPSPSAPGDACSRPGMNDSPHGRFERCRSGCSYQKLSRAASSLPNVSKTVSNFVMASSCWILFVRCSSFRCPPLFRTVV